MKTADEMFAELGYKLAEDNKFYRIYEKEYEQNGNTFRIQLCVGEEETTKDCESCFHRMTYSQYLDGDEILACAELIKEMRGSQ